MIESLLVIVFGSMFLMTLIYSLYIVMVGAEASYQRNVYAGVLSMWIAAISSVLVRRVVYLINGIEVKGFLYCGSTIMGMICLMIMVWYLVAVLFQKRIKLKWTLLVVMPTILVVVANLIWNSYNGLSFNHFYATFAEFKANAFSVTSLLRYSMLLLQVGYILFIIYSIRRLVPIYNKYISDTHSDESYNLNWLYKYYKVLCSISVVYFLICIAPNCYTYLLYIVVATYAFISLTSSVWEYKSFPKIEEVEPYWSPKTGWSARFPSEVQQQSTINPENDNVSVTVTELKRYIIEHELYTTVDLTMNELLACYPELTSQRLINMLANEGFTFQSFIRQIRVERAAEIIRVSENRMIYKDIYYQVGFSQYSSFARAFTAITGISPSNYNQDR